MDIEREMTSLFYRKLTLLIISLLVFSMVGFIVAENTVNNLALSKVYYGYITYVRGNIAVLYIAGTEDDTQVKVFIIDNPSAPSLLTEATINRGELLTVKISKFVYKIVSTKPVVALQGAGDHVYEFGYATFIPALDTKKYIGKEFIFPGMPTGAEKRIFLYFFIAFEDSEVTIKNFSDPTWELTLPVAAGDYFSIWLSGETVYEVTSTGNIAIHAQPHGGLAAAPTPDGEIVGKEHFGIVPGYFVVNIFEPGEVRVYDAETEELIASQTFDDAPAYWEVDLDELAPDSTWHLLRFESTCDTYIYLGVGGDGMCMAGGKKIDSEYVYVMFSGPVPHEGKNEIAIVVPEEATVKLTVGGKDVDEWDMKPEEHRIFSYAGLNVIHSSVPLAVFQLFGCRDAIGIFLVSDPSFPATEPEATAGGGGGVDITLVIGIIVIILIVVGIIFLKKKKK